MPIYAAVISGMRVRRRSHLLEAGNVRSYYQLTPLNVKRLEMHSYVEVQSMLEGSEERV